MPTISTLVVAVRADIKQFQAGMAQAEAQTVGATNTMGSGISKFGAIASVAAGVAAIALVKFGEEAIQVAAEHEKTLAQLQLQVGGTTAGYEKQAQALESLTGFQHDEVLAADTVLARLHLTQAQIQGLVPAILDFAAATGTDAAGASATFEKALLGTARGLKVGGIAFKDTGTLAGNYAELIKLTSTASIKGSAALDTYAKKQRELQSAITDLKEEVGTALLPVMGQLTTTLANLVTSVGPLVTAFFKGVADEAQILTQNLNDILGPIEKITSSLPGLSKGADDTGISFGNVFHALQDVANPMNWNILIKGRKAWADLHGAAEQAAQGTNAAGDAAATAAQKEQTLAAAHDKVVEAAKAQRQAEQALAGGLLGLAADAKTLADAQDAVNKLQKAGKTHTDDYRQAVLAQLNATVQIKGDLLDYAKNLDAAGKSNEEVKQKLITLGRQFGLTKADVIDAIGGVTQFTNKLKSMAAAGNAAGQNLAHGFADGITSGIAGARGAAQHLGQAALDQLNTTLGTHSPSTITEKIGEDVVQGLINGLKAREKDVQKVFDSLSNKLQNLTSRASDFRSAISGGFGSLLDLSNIPEGGDIASFVAESAASAKQWGAVLNALQRQGLSGPLLSQIAGMGPQALGMAQQLLQLGPQQIAAINQQYQAILKVQDHVSKSLTEKYFGDKIDQLREVLGDVRETLHHIAKRLDDLSGHALGGIATRPTLGIFGEHGPEALVPLGAGAGMGGITGPIVIQLDGKQLAVITRDELLKLGARNGTTGL